MAVKRQIVWGVASLAALYVGVTNALGLGELKLDSALNQPLDATISLQGAANLDPADIRVSLADTAAFQNAGLDRAHFLTELRFTPTVQNNQLVIRVQSTNPVREPYLNFLVELRRPSGRLLREYTLLLDPPMYQPPSMQPRPAAAPVSSAPVSRQPASAPRQSASAAPVTAVPLPQLEAAPGAKQYRTSAGDSLWTIAAQTRPNDSVSIPETMRAIRALNPNAFIDGDPARLRVGQLLTLPTADQLGTTSDSAPEQEAASNPEETAAAMTPPLSTASARSADSSRDVANQSSIQGESSGSTDAAGTPSARLRIEEEAVEASQGDAIELAARLRNLEARFNVMLDELDARDRQIASLQAELDILRQAQQAEGASSSNAIEGAAGETLTASQGTDGGDVSATGSEQPVAGAVEAEVLPPQEQSLPTDTETQAVAGETQAVEQQSLLLRWWPALLALLAVLIGLLAFARKRSTDDDEPDADQPERVMPAQPVTPKAEPIAPLAAAAGAAAARPAPVRSAPKPVDPLDGVELYITYGRFAEARSMLDKAIEQQPNRLDLRYKQLRVLAELGEARAFAAQERQILDMKGDVARIEQIKGRFPELFASTDADLVEQVDRVEPMLDDEPTTPQPASTTEADELAATQLNLNDFTLDPDWDLIEGLTSDPVRKGTESAEPKSDEPFESSLHEFPEIEELHGEHDEHFPGRGTADDSRPGQK